ncbi:hypothetical protein CKN99_05970 [Carnobacterium maltaromaticum]|uniref:hypothetical protein n=1 Tax=Carnobacterium maltaromaticum TaxID=2751 RepID=UPI0010720567|nr:hypothetical protein [Carnobacterium maltaromaticum]MDT1946054.1 hypothetical protein [Carnobacterium maltaromaticum]MDT2000558.1 hypothetical protein [Carnobacterium maltaromaticum]TFJ28857.1 hypothetical protein CKN90_05925 [Carnobacterium maltaromaticum]TFJ32555.1 hypothetical protein CKN98_05935 [Carnobacterium maltaromaticum]TFJ36583.1 hypothetical protein CKN88_05995 [Carnobacterium maltaromaticum]
MQTRELITEGNVIKIIDSYRILINKGYNDSVTKNSIVEVFKKGEEIFDPFSKYSLGTLDFIKDELKVTTIYPQMAICETGRSKFKGTTPAMAASQTLADSIGKISQSYYGSRIEIVEQINIDPEEISGGFDREEKIIKLGDSVRIYLESK